MSTIKKKQIKEKISQTEKFLRAIEEEGCEDSLEEFEAKLTKTSGKKPLSKEEVKTLAAASAKARREKRKKSGR